MTVPIKRNICDISTADSRGRFYVRYPYCFIVFRRFIKVHSVMNGFNLIKSFLMIILWFFSLIYEQLFHLETTYFSSYYVDYITTLVLAE